MSETWAPRSLGYEPGAGPWTQAWRRLRRNRMALVALAVVFVVGMSALFAPWVAPFDPRVMERWAGALSPGARHLELRNEMLFTRGVAPAELDVPQAAFDALGDGREHTLELSVAHEQVTTYRVVLDDGIVQQIGEGGNRLERLDVPTGQVLRVRGGEELEVSSVEIGAGLAGGAESGAGREVAMLELVSRSRDGAYDATIRFDGAGRVADITTTGTPAESSLRVRGDEVVDVRLDGVRLEHTHVLGTDQEGRDALSRVIHGGRISLLVGLVATLVSLVIGVLYGATSGYLGGRRDVLMMRAVDVLYAMPYLFVVILLMITVGESLIVLFMALGAVQWLTPARVVRGQVLSLKHREFIDAARTLGASGWTILRRHLIPNTLGVVVVFTTLTIPAVILEESFLSFIGLRVYLDGQPVDSWGALVANGREALGRNGERWWLLVFPAATMSLTLLSLNFLGDGLRDALDPQQRGRR